MQRSSRHPTGRTTKEGAAPPQTQSSRPRPRRPHPKGEGQGAAAFHKPVHPRRGLGESGKREPSTNLCCRRVPPSRSVISSWSTESLHAKLRVPGPGPGKQKELSSDAGSGAGLDRQLQPTTLPSASSIQSRAGREGGEGKEPPRAGAAPASSPGKLRAHRLPRAHLCWAAFGIFASS